MQKIQMCDLKPGQGGVVSEIRKSSISRRLQDLGVVQGSRVLCLGKPIWKDPTVYLICGAAFALRKEACREVFLKEIVPWSA